LGQKAVNAILEPIALGLIGELGRKKNVMKRIGVGSWSLVVLNWVFTIPWSTIPWSDCLDRRHRTNKE
jgi:predicted Abi (CAAX) family protease